MFKILVLDCETTGLTTKDQVIELAYIKITELFHYVMDSMFVSRYKPSVLINTGAYKVHNITMRDLVHAPKSSTVSIPEDVQYIIGANISFDIRLLQQSNPNLNLSNIKLICIQDLAKLVNKIENKFENVKLATLFSYYFPDDALNYAPYHTATNDVTKTYRVLNELLKHFPQIKNVHELYDFIQTTKKVKRC